jgi:aminopeptidase N
MENWGAIFYTDRALLLSPDSTMQDRQSTYSIQAHEMAHQWNGDLVTMGWWDDLWLNESFASWRSAKETDARNPTWRWWEGQDADKEKGMTADARPSSHAIHVHITDELQAETAFDGEITYSKGQAFLRMLEAYLTPDVFRSGIRRYIKARAYSNATGADLWLALGKASDQDVAGLASTWIMRPGFPLVTVNAKCDPGGTRMLNLTQKRFLRDGTDPLHTTWSIPLRVRSGTIGASTGVLFSAATQTISSGRCGEPLTIDAGNAGFFRVAYDDETFRANAASFGRLPDPDRIALLDDQWALASSGQAPLATYFTLARSMGDDLDTRAWEQIIAALDTIQYSERGTRGHAAFVAFARSIVRPVAVRLGPHAQPNEGPGTQMLRRDVLAELGAWGDPAIIAQARRRFAAFVRDRRTISPDDQPAILDIVAENADAATFEQLHSIARTAKSTSDVRRYYDVLMHVRNDALAQRAANIALSAEIPAQAASARYRLLDALAYEHPALAWRALTANIDAVLIAPNGESDGLETLAHYVPGKFWNSAPPQEIQTYIYGRIPPDLRPDLARGMDDVHFSLKQHALLDAATDAYLKQSISQ